MMKRQVFLAALGWVAIAVLLCVFPGCGREPVGVVLRYRAAPAGFGARGTVDMHSLVVTIDNRLEGAGRARAVSRDEVEVEVYGDPNQVELESIQFRISTIGELEFRILADSTQPQDRSIIEQAKRAPPSQRDVTLDGTKVAEWVTYSKAEFGPVDEELGGMVKRVADDRPEALVLMDQLHVTGQYLTSATKGLDERGQPAIHLTFDREGARRFYRLTSENKPKREMPSARRQLGILLDKRLISAPFIYAAVSDRAMIGGGSLTERDVDSIIAILQAGQLPCPVRLVEEKRLAK
jgi:preprotein translocase subunit SecD